ncbi:hypothetical protein J1N35_040362 [Gossypium stocksii]|uniref:PB1 domain-containing protein n=1 Tax=Gossypium stocksii TaxID=47602 RepID=A0A9D3UE25_9ROSI|nr:hypothetical protein J1N35_040362 [Gossypium stocksii]
MGEVLHRFTPQEPIEVSTIGQTFINEDGDIVLLVYDDDLYDVMRQHLKFLRINMQQNDNMHGKPCVVASKSSNPLRLPSAQPPSKGFNVVVVDRNKQPVAYTRSPCTTIDVFDPDPLGGGVL